MVSSPSTGSDHGPRRNTQPSLHLQQLGHCVHIRQLTTPPPVLCTCCIYTSACCAHAAPPRLLWCHPSMHIASFTTRIMHAGGTSSACFGVGAYVSPALAAAGHSVLAAPNSGLQVRSVSQQLLLYFYFCSFIVLFPNSEVRSVSRQQWFSAQKAT